MGTLYMGKRIMGSIVWENNRLYTRFCEGSGHPGCVRWETGYSIYHGAEIFCIKIDDNIVVEILGKRLVLRQCLPLHAT